MREVLKSLKGRNELVDLRRDGPNMPDFRCFVVDCSEEYVLVRVASDDIIMSGYSVLRVKDICLVRRDSARLRAWAASLGSIPKGRVRCPRVHLRNWATIIRSVCRVEPIITFMREESDGTRCNIGCNVKVCRGIVQADEVSTEGVLDGRMVFTLDGLTRIDFGGNYEKGLVRVLGADGYRKKSR